jgi:hypothetical protein
MHSELRQELIPLAGREMLQESRWQMAVAPCGPLASLVSGERIALEAAELRRESCKVFRSGIEKPHCASRGGEIP